jgi:hypothetical protein
MVWTPRRGVQPPPPHLLNEHLGREQVITASLWLALDLGDELLELLRLWEAW